MPRISAIAKNYAKALFVAAKKDGALDEVSKELDTFKGGFSSEFAHELKNPVISKSDLIEIIGDVTKKFKFGKLVSNFFSSVAKNRRLNLFPEIHAEYSQLLKAHNDVLEIEVITASKADEAQIESIKTLIAKKYQDKKIIVKETVEAKILGGFQVRIGSKLIDATLQNQIKKLSLACLEASN